MKFKNLLKKFGEPSAKAVISFAVLGVVALLVVGALGQGNGSYLYTLNNPNTTATAVTTISGTVLPIIFLVAIVLKFI